MCALAQCRTCQLSSTKRRDCQRLRNLRQNILQRYFVAKKITTHLSYLSHSVYFQGDRLHFPIKEAQMTQEIPIMYFHNLQSEFYVIRSITCYSYVLMILLDCQKKMADFVLMISLDLMKSTEVRIAGDGSNDIK